MYRFPPPAVVAGLSTGVLFALGFRLPESPTPAAQSPIIDGRVGSIDSTPQSTKALDTALYTAQGAMQQRTYRHRANPSWSARLFCRGNKTICDLPPQLAAPRIAVRRWPITQSGLGPKGKLRSRGVDHTKPYGREAGRNRRISKSSFWSARPGGPARRHPA